MKVMTMSSSIVYNISFTVTTETIVRTQVVKLSKG